MSSLFERLELRTESLQALKSFLGHLDFKPTSVAGGSINQVFKIEELRVDPKVFLFKYKKDTPKGFFKSEQLNLKELNQCPSIRTPQVFLSGDDFILMEWIERKRSITDENYKDAGRCLFQLHQIQEEHFGFPEDNFIGLLPQCNTQHRTWAEFWIKERLEPQAKLAKSKLDKKTAQEFRHLFKKLPSYFEDKDFIKPSLLHGDLWGGNHLFDQKNHFCLIDPATYYGHCEVDLAFATCFGSYPRVFFDAYFERVNDAQIQKGFWRERLYIYQLYLWLIHLNLFGQSYLSSVQEALSNIFANEIKNLEA
jgi:fructosamine-3-kinase